MAMYGHISLVLFTYIVRTTTPTHQTVAEKCIWWLPHRVEVKKTGNTTPKSMLYFSQIM